MFSPAVTTLYVLAVTAAYVSAASYKLQDNFVGEGFLSGFDHQAIADPTHGRVNYVDQGTAVAKNLTYAHGNTLILRADSTTTLSPSGPGRNSVRIKSKKTYTTHVAIFDIKHMPQGCATWPAAWETQESNWPNGGEVDIVEGVNDAAPNAATLHTSSGCTMPAQRTMTGTATSTNCDANVNGNQGCGVLVNKANSYGPGFNNNGGGIYAMERTNNFIKVFFWPRNDGSLPNDIRSNSNSIYTDNWGSPVAFFPNTNCNLSQKFGPNNIIINLTLCGDWAGAVFNSDGCSGNCADFVNQNPAAFKNAYWEISSVRVFV